MLYARTLMQFLLPAIIEAIAALVGLLALACALRFRSRTAALLTLVHPFTYGLASRQASPTRRDLLFCLMSVLPIFNLFMIVITVCDLIGFLTGYNVVRDRPLESPITACCGVSRERG